MKRIGFFLVCGFLLLGCTQSGGNSLLQAGKNAQVKQMIAQHPGATIQVAYFSKDQVAQLLGSLRQQCGDQFQAAAYYKVTFDSADAAGVFWLDESGQRVLCGTLKPKPSPTPGATPTSAATPAPSPTSTASPSAGSNPTARPTASPSYVPPAVPGASATPTPGPTVAPTLLPTVTATPTATPSATPSATPVPSPTPAPSATPSPTPAPTLAASPSPTPTPSPTASPTVNPGNYFTIHLTDSIVAPNGMQLQFASMNSTGDLAFYLYQAAQPNGLRPFVGRLTLPHSTPAPYVLDGLSIQDFGQLYDGATPANTYATLQVYATNDPASLSTSDTSTRVALNYHTLHVTDQDALTSGMSVVLKSVGAANATFDILQPGGHVVDTVTLSASGNGPDVYDLNGVNLQLYATGSGSLLAQSFADVTDRASPVWTSANVIR